MIKIVRMFMPVAAALLLQQAFAANAGSSVLASGQWYRFGVTQSGIHQLTYNDLVALSIDPSTILTEKIRIYGNGSGMLPEINQSPRIDDLRQISVRVMDGGDGRFDPGDRVIFYGESPDRWKYDRLTRNYSHQRNLYSDTTWYYLNFDQGPGKRVEDGLFPGTATHSTGFYDDFVFHEADLYNLVRSGKEWYGEPFDNTRNEYSFPFSFPGIDPSWPVRVKWSVVANSTAASYFYLSNPSGIIDSLKIDSTDPKEFTRAGRAKSKNTTFPSPGPDQTLILKYVLPNPTSRGWLNFLEVSCRRALAWSGPQMLFRDLNSIATGRITEFSMTGALEGVEVWDVTDPAEIRRPAAVLADGILKFTVATDTLREFIAFDGTGFLPVFPAGTVANQDLHAAQPAEMVIVTHPLFTEQAERLADFHREHNDLSVLVVNTEQVFHEFGCGQPDPGAIRDFVKMLYDRGTEENRPRYLLLFGDGSYDPKNRIPGNNNLVPTFQSAESLNSTISYVTDDFFGIMVNNGGQDANGIIHIGIGRFPVSTQEQARDMVDKIVCYGTCKYPVTSEWRNMITFVADDENQNLHLHQAEELCTIVGSKYPAFNVDKIFLDAYQLVKIPGGERFPDANTAINRAVEKGSLIVNYTGHGGETGWSFEQVLNVSDINNWNNGQRLPVFITATCEFSRFDNPERYTAGEMLINRPLGGAIALYSTTRLAFAGLNILLNTSFFEHLMDKDANGGYVKMGDLIRFSKNDNANNFQLRNFVLLGDPAQNIAFPSLRVSTTSVNGLPPDKSDTLLGCSQATLEGQVEDAAGIKAQDFNGWVNCKLYDKPVTYTTLGQRPSNNESYPENFVVQNSLLFEGTVPVTNGSFRCSFTVPKGISLPYGKGKISYYAWDEQHEASGYDSRHMVGGRDGSVNPVNEGPQISLYLDDRDFISGGQVGRAAMLIADLYDTNGINYLGLGIGHEIEAVLDGDRSGAMVLNDYFAQALNSSTRGSLVFPIDGLAPGHHTLQLRAWDMFDNSSVKEIEFEVPENNELMVTEVRNAPNPLYDETKFLFRPQEFEAGGLDVQIQIYNLMGYQVRVLDKAYQQPLPNSGEITWDGTDAAGHKLPSGIYPYKMIFRATNGAFTQTSQKLIIAR